MAMLLALPAAGAMVILAAHPREPLRDRLVEGTVEGFYLIQKTGCENNLFIKQDDLFYFFTPPPSLIVPRRLIRAPPALTNGQTPLPIHTLSRAHVFGWLLLLFNVVGSHLRPRRVLFLFFYSPSIRRLVQGDNTPPHVPSWPPLLSNAPSNVDTTFHLIVVSPF